MEKISKRWQGPDSSSEEIKKKLFRYAQRRDQLVHEADLDNNNKTRRIAVDYAFKIKIFVEKMVSVIQQERPFT